MRRTPLFIPCATVTLGAGTYLLVSHVLDLANSTTNVALAFAVMFVYLIATTVLSLAASPRTAPREAVLGISADIVMPVYNEDPALAAEAVHSFGDQTVLPRAVWIVDDGSALPSGEPDLVLDTPEVFAAVESLRSRGVVVHTTRQANAGKRHAQAVAFEASDAEVFVTVDSDTVLDPRAVEKILVPFTDDRVQSVGGSAYGQNHRHSLFTRVVELGFAMAFISGRAAEGFFGAVRVNCGILAAYRGDLVRDNLERYLNQTFLGRPQSTGDDRALTIFALERGRAEFQADAIAYSALPVTWKHLVKQRIRWARSYYWGTAWLFRRPLRSAEFLLSVAQTLGMVTYLVVFSAAVVGTATGAIAPRFVVNSLVISACIGAVCNLRYVAAGRPDESVWHRLVTWMLSPLSTLLYLAVLNPLYWWAAITMRPQQSWGTRGRVEVGLSSTQLAGQVARPAPAGGGAVDLRDDVLVDLRSAAADADTRQTR